VLCSNGTLFVLRKKCKIKIGIRYLFLKLINIHCFEGKVCDFPCTQQDATESFLLCEYLHLFPQKTSTAYLNQEKIPLSVFVYLLRACHITE
jgi:hypothetical protein